MEERSGVTGGFVGVARWDGGKRQGFAVCLPVVAGRSDGQRLSLLPPPVGEKTPRAPGPGASRCMPALLDRAGPLVASRRSPVFLWELGRNR
jgi:hypothetical protein